MAIFILWWFILQRGGFLHSANATVGMTDVSGLAVTNVNVPRFRPCGRMAADCRRYSGGTTFRVVPFTPYTEQCSGVDPTPSSPGEGLAPWDTTDTNIQRVALRPMAADCRRYSGGTTFRVVPFNPTGYTSHVAGGRLPMELRCDCPRQSIDFDLLREAPPLRYICYKYRIFNVSIIVLHYKKCEKTPSRFWWGGVWRFFRAFPTIPGRKRLMFPRNGGSTGGFCRRSGG